MTATSESFHTQRDRMVTRQIAARGIADPAVLCAMSKVQREGYVPSYLGEFAYEDTPLPIEEEQTISQPYIVSFMVEALQLEPTSRVLEVGTGSGYAAAVLGEIAAEVYTIERHERLATSARERLARDGYQNVHVRHGDGSVGWLENAPFDAIVVAAGGPDVPEALLSQLRVGGRLVMPVGEELGRQKLVRIVRVSEDRFEEEELADVRFVPLVGAEGFRVEPPHEDIQPVRARPHKRPDLPDLVRRCAEPFDPRGPVDWSPLLERIGDARVVLLGEASHGTSEFYSLRADLTRELIEKQGFRIVAAEADWPDAALIDHYVRQRSVPRSEWEAFARFPTWMWRNAEVQRFVDWLFGYNEAQPASKRVRFAGLDIYGMYNSIAAVIEYLDERDPRAAQVARARYGCLTPWQSDPSAYGRAALIDSYRSCEGEVVEMLESMMARRLQRSTEAKEAEALFDAHQNARLIANGEAYYRGMYYAAHASWNFRDRHMFGTLQRLLDFHGPDCRAVVWAHNSHVGDARATEMSARQELNLGQLCRTELSSPPFLVGFGTHRGTVAAASYWDGPLEIKQVRPSLPESYEHVCHESDLGSFRLPLRNPSHSELRTALDRPRLQRAIGVIYRPETERASHYLQCVLPRQFDEYLWIPQTSAVKPLETSALAGLAETYPFGL